MVTHGGDGYDDDGMYQEFSGRPVSELFAAENQVGRAFLFFPMGMTMSRSSYYEEDEDDEDEEDDDDDNHHLDLEHLSSMDDEFGEDLGLSLDDVPDLVNFTLRHIRNLSKLLNL